MGIKRCPKCKLDKDLSEFNKAQNRKQGVQTYCRECQKHIDKKFYKEHEGHRTKAKDRRKNYKLSVREFLWSYLKSHPCVVCQEDDPLVLTFDHLRDKEFDVGLGASKGYSLTRIRDEIDKCQVLCANCHMRKTAKDFGWYKDFVGR